MRILVTADTHIPVAAKSLPLVIEEEAKKSDCCLHAGDLIECEVFDKLSQLGLVHAVYGNMDSQEVIDKLPQKRIIKFDQVTVGLTHGRGAPETLIAEIDKIFAMEREKIDIFVFGHSHASCDKEINGKIYFNPGSCTDTIFATKRSYGILEITGREIKRRIINIG